MIRYLKYEEMRELEEPRERERKKCMPNPEKDTSYFFLLKYYGDTVKRRRIKDNDKGETDTGRKRERKKTDNRKREKGNKEKKQEKKIM